MTPDQPKSVYEWRDEPLRILWRNGEAVGYACYRDSFDKLLVYTWVMLVGERRFGRATSFKAAVDAVEASARAHFGDEI
jgi:hypothetical protein